MTCLYFRSLLDDLLDRELSSPLETSVKAHLEVCAACREEYEETARLRQLLSTVTIPEPSSEYWRESADLIIARTVETSNIVSITDEIARRSAERKSFYRALVAVAASLVLFFGSLLIGSSAPFTGEPRFTYVDPRDEVIDSSPSGSRVTGDNYISADEQALIAGSMLLVGTPGMLASSSGLGISLGTDDGR